MTHSPTRGTDSRGLMLPVLGSRSRAVIAMLGLLLAAAEASAVVTPAGTLIQAAAEVTARIGADFVAVRSNAPALVVDQILEVAVTALAPTAAVQAGDSGRVSAFRIGNAGNGPEALRLSLVTAVNGNAFDLVAHSPALYLDTDRSGTLGAGDVAYAPGSNDPVVVAGASIVVFAVADVPAGVADGARSRLQLAARALAGSGAPGSFFPGTGVGGVDALVGASGGAGQAAADLVVSGVDVAVAKQATVVDGRGGHRAESGARIDYDIAVTVTGVAPARAVVVRDPIPAQTQYLAGSLMLDGTALTDLADGDVGALLAAPPRIEVSLGELAPGTTHHVRFSVLIL